MRTLTVYIIGVIAAMPVFIWLAWLRGGRIRAKQASLVCAGFLLCLVAMSVVANLFHA